jgi:hypothetical protein
VSRSLTAEQSLTREDHASAGVRPRRGLRLSLAAAALVAAAAHVPVTPEHLEEAPYMGVLFVLLSVACLGIAGLVLVRDDPVVYAAAATVCGLAVLGYAATRLVPFPQLADDVGNWFEPLGVVSVLTESVVVVCALAALRGTGSQSSLWASHRAGS